MRLVGPNCPGVLSPGKANVGIIPAQFFKPGNVGVVSRSGTLTYQIGNELARSGFGNSTIVGIGGDPVPGSSFVDIIALFEADPETELIVMSGEIGGSAEEEAAAFIAENVSKPVVAYIAGLTAPPGKTMGHAGAIVSGSSGGGQAKIDALEGVGVRVGRTPTQVAEIAMEILGRSRRVPRPGDDGRSCGRSRARLVRRRSPDAGYRILRMSRASGAPPSGSKPRRSYIPRAGLSSSTTRSIAGQPAARAARSRGRAAARRCRARGGRA